jgi:monofunctional biosynthetic peptidoglycan transglycosylase
VARLALKTRLAAAALRMCAWLLLLTAMLVLPLRWASPLTSSFMLQNWASQPDRPGLIHYDWVGRTRISREAAIAVLATEDQRFFEHHGFDFAAIIRVLRGATGGPAVRGASTISQQVAKNLWLWPARSWLRKGIEAYLTAWLELALPKERILEIYLNVAQFGPDVFGIEAASQKYFRKPALRLNRPEAALLAAVLPNPRLLEVRNPSSFVRQRQRWIERHAERLARTVDVDRWGSAAR